VEHLGLRGKLREHLRLRATQAEFSFPSGIAISKSGARAQETKLVGYWSNHDPYGDSVLMTIGADRAISIKHTAFGYSSFVGTWSVTEDRQPHVSLVDGSDLPFTISRDGQLINVCRGRRCTSLLRSPN
jgi:hypothetical protein